jgi:cell volume regulation protein A
MSEVQDFGLVIAVASAVFALAVLSNKVSERTAVPAPAFFLLAAALASRIFPDVGTRL